jgi:hypothetical protein
VLATRDADVSCGSQWLRLLKAKIWGEKLGPAPHSPSLQSLGIARHLSPEAREWALHRINLEVTLERYSPLPSAA